MYEERKCIQGVTEVGARELGEPNLNLALPLVIRHRQALPEAEVLTRSSPNPAFSSAKNRQDP